MLKLLTSAKSLGAAALTVLTIAGATVAAPTSAEARYRHHNNGAAIAAGVIGGLALGAIAAQSYRSHGYYGAPVYYGAPRHCWTERRVVRDRWGYRHVERVRVCR